MTEEEKIKKKKESIRRAVKKYDKENTRTFAFKFNKKNDSDIIEKLDTVHNRAGYIKELIRRDITSSADSGS
ncbi:MAG: hypothetical protein K6G63_06945 [Eubacterium sp.]|nr:hypothetical protein [Eubacterium sp.]